LGNISNLHDHPRDALERPLLVGDSDAPSAATRPAKAGVQTSPTQGSAFQLSGVITGPDTSYAIVKHLTNNKTKSVRQGEEIDGWAVEESASKYVSLHRGDERIRVELSTRSGAVTPGGGAIRSPNRSVQSPRLNAPSPQLSAPYPQAATTPPALVRQRERAALRAQRSAARSASRVQQQQRVTACRLQARQRGLRRQSLRAFVRSCSGR
jgi:hypothetical protein